MRNTRRTSVRVFGIKIAEIEVMTEFGGKGPERGNYGRQKPGVMSIDPDLLTPLLIDSAKSLYGLVPDKISFIDGQPLEVNGNVDSEIACQILRDVNKLTKEQAVQVLFGLASQTNLLGADNKTLAAAFRRHIETAVEAYWK